MITEATVQHDNNGYWLHPNMVEHDFDDINDWIANAEQNGFEVEKHPSTGYFQPFKVFGDETEVLSLDGRIRSQDGGAVYRCSTSPTEYVDVVIYEG